MKPSPDSSDARWAQLTTLARADTPPATDLSAVLKAVRAEAAARTGAAPRNWLDDFAALFASPRRLTGCGTFAALALAGAVWYGMDTWTQLEPWAGLVWSALEGNI